VSTLVFMLPGLGDALATGPILDGIAAHGGTVDVVTMLQPVAEYARSLPMVDHIEHFDLHSGRAGAFGAALRLRKRHYDLAILPFPATRWEYHALALAVGAKRLITHAYGGIADALDTLAHGTKVPLRGGHRAAENGRLARAIGVEGRLVYIVPESWRAPTRAGLLGVHSGTMRYKGNEVRRWPVERFAELIERNAAHGRRVRVFIGPHETGDELALAHLREYPEVEFVKTDLAGAARALSECEVFVANDAGFAHLASGLGVKTIVLFGMTDPHRLQPLGPSVVVRPTSCPPCHDEGRRTFACALDIGYRCTREDLTVDAAQNALELAFAGPVVEFKPRISGPFRLYGRPREAAAEPAMTATESATQSNAHSSEIASGS
jgi:heptosyltransferase-2